MTEQRRPMWRGTMAALMAMVVGAVCALVGGAPADVDAGPEHDYTDGQFDNVVKSTICRGTAAGAGSKQRS